MADKKEIAAMALIPQIKQCHEECKKGFVKSIEWGIRCGELLCEMKDLVGHGNLGGLIEQYLPFSTRSAQSYMSLHKRLCELPNAQRAALLNSADSMRAVYQLLPSSNKKPPSQPKPTAALNPSGGKAEITSSNTPSSGVSDPFDGFDSDDFGEPNGEQWEENGQKTPSSGRKKPSKVGKREAPPVTQKTEQESAVWRAQQTLKSWADAVGRWMPTIDEYREQFPGKLGDRVIEQAKALWTAMEAWKRGIK